MCYVFLSFHDGISFDIFKAKHALFSHRKAEPTHGWMYQYRMALKIKMTHFIPMSVEILLIILPIPSKNMCQSIYRVVYFIPFECCGKKVR